MTFNLCNGLRVTKMYFFISKNMNKGSVYHFIHEFSDLEEIKENFSEIFSNLRKLRFVADFGSSQKKMFFATICCLNTGEFFAKVLNLSTNLKIINHGQYLFNKISNKISIKALIQIEL